MRLNMSLAGVQRMFRDVYGERNERLYDSENLLLRVFEETAVIAEIRRKEDHDGLGAAIAGFFGWLLGFCNNEGIGLARLLPQLRQETALYLYQRRNQANTLALGPERRDTARLARVAGDVLQYLWPG